MFSKWKSGRAAYMARGIVYLLIGAGIAATGSFAASKLFGYGIVRHPLSSVAVALILMTLPFALRRRRILRFGHQATWLKVHWVTGGAALTLVLIHSSLSPGTLSGWGALSVAVIVLVSGLVTHLTTRWTRHYALKVHLVGAVAIVAAFAAHGIYKTNHPWFPLETKTPKNEVVHDVACAVCHKERNVYTAYACRSCHIHNTEELAFAHKVHGVYEWDRCLDCHRATIDGKRYFSGDGWRVVPGNAFDFGE